MCLDIAYSFHLNKHVQKYAQFDIVCYKVLNFRSFYGSWISPYQGQIYEFGTLYTENRIKVNRYDQVERGLHSWTTRERARELAYNGRRVFPAIIPKGSKVWVGNDDDLASSALIVYESKKYLEAVHGKIQPAILKSKGLR